MTTTTDAAMVAASAASSAASKIAAPALWGGSSVAVYVSWIDADWITGAVAVAVALFGAWVKWQEHKMRREQARMRHAEHVARMQALHATGRDSGPTEPGLL